MFREAGYLPIQKLEKISSKISSVSVLPKRRSRDLMPCRRHSACASIGIFGERAVKISNVSCATCWCRRRVNGPEGGGRVCCLRQFSMACVKGCISPF